MDAQPQVLSGLARAWTAFGLGWALGAVACGSRTGLESPDVEPEPGTSTDLVTLSCPASTDDPRLPITRPGQPVSIDGQSFASGPVVTWHWEVEQSGCDAVVASPSYRLEHADQPVATFTAGRPTAYRLTLSVTDSESHRARCSFELPGQGVGLRVELCWDSSTVADIDLYLHTPYGSAPWYRPGSSGVIAGMDGTTCNGGNCTPELRFGLMRVDWGYADSRVADCEAGPSTQAFRALGRCPNPRFGLDNNQQIATGISEIVQLDNPSDGQTFRIMVQNFDNQPAVPSVVVYCAGRIAGELGPPDWPPGFADSTPGGYGVMWRPADVTARVAPTGTTTDCVVRELTHPSRGGAYVTLDDASY